MPFVLFGLLLALAIMLLFGGTEMDRGLLVLVSGVDAPRLKEAARIVEWAAQPGPLIGVTVAGVAWLLARREWRNGLLLGALILSGWAVIDILQHATAAIRPGLEERVRATQMIGGFPNGEVAHATLVMLALPLLLTATRPARPIIGTIGAFLALAIGWARILRGESWPSDVIGGWGVALLWVLVPLRLAGHDIGDGTPRRLRHSSLKENVMENPRTETARQDDDRDIIEGQEGASGIPLSSGGGLQRDIGSRDELAHGDTGEPGTERVRAEDKGDNASEPRFSERQ